MEAEIASIAASISVKGERGRGASALFDDSRSIIDRIRYARGQLNKPDWWGTQLGAASTDFDRFIWALTCFAWASPDTVGSLMHDFESTVSLLAQPTKDALVRACKRSSTYSRSNKRLNDQSLTYYRELSDPAAISILWRRLPPLASIDLMRNLWQQEIDSSYVADAVLHCTALIWFAGGKVSPADMIRAASRCHDAGAFEATGIRHLSKADRRSLGVDWAKAAINNSWSMPSDFLYMAYRVLDQERPDPEPVLKVAQRQDWFRGEPDNWGQR